jgi:HEAT repeat protein
VAADRRADRRRRRVTLAGHRGDAATARRGLGDPDARVQVAALGALARLGALTAADVAAALGDGPPALRRRAVEAAAGVGGKGSRSTLVRAVTGALDDPDPLVVVGTAWFLAERRHRAAVPLLVTTATGHPDVRCREAAVAALGAIGDPVGLPAVLTALGDKPTVRRRATVALAGFDDPRVEAALRAAAVDRDWQVRQAAAELLDESPDG